MNNFILKTPFADLVVRSFEMADPAILVPTNANPLVMGEFLELDANYKLARGAGDGTLANVFAFFQGMGSYDIQAIQKAPVLFINNYEADTMVFDAAVEAGITAVGQPLMVNDVTIGGLVKRGLTALPGAPVGTEHVVGYVTRLPASNGGYLRFRRVDG